MTLALDDVRLAVVRRRSLAVLSAGQVLSGLAVGVTVSLGAVLAAAVSGDDGFAGLAAALTTLGAAAAAVPLAALARTRGRRPALAGGALTAFAGVALAVVAAATPSFATLLIAFALIGVGQAAGLQSRFAATDLATDATRGRDLSLVVWSTTVGAVLGPNLVGVGGALGDLLGMPPLTGAYLFSLAGQAAAATLYLVLLRPDPLRVAAAVEAAPAGAAPAIARLDRPVTARYAIGVVATAHLVMVSVMAMTPVHVLHVMHADGGAALTVIGLTISVHIAGMYAVSPVFGWLADRWGRPPTILLGQGVFVAALVLLAVAPDSLPAVGAGLFLIGLGWSASTVAGSALLTEATSAALRTRRQGISDLTMNLVAAIGAVVAGAVLGVIRYEGLALSALVAVAAVVIATPLARRGAPTARVRRER